MNNNGVGGDPSERNRKENMKTIQDYPFFADIPAKTYHEEARAGKYLSSHLLGDFRHCPRLYRQKMTGEIPPQDTAARDIHRSALP